MDDTIETGFVLTTEQPKIIKVIGIGGGGGNAVSHMFNQGIHDVTFLLCNTDMQDLQKSAVPDKLVLGEKRTEGWGAGSNPDIAREAANESEDDIARRFSDGTKMVFITAGMGGGTGTGAAPVIAGLAKKMGILTVGIVTIPFSFEGEPRIIRALRGLDEMHKNVDALLVISNDRLFDLYDDNVSIDIAFAKADDTLHIAAKGIADLITTPGRINLDFADVKTALENSGVALISNGYGDGSTRLQSAIDEAVKSPLLNNNNVFDAKKILLNVASSAEKPLTIGETKDIREFMQKFDQSQIQTKWGMCIDNSLESRVKVTILASGFTRKAIPGMGDMEDKPENIKQVVEGLGGDIKVIGNAYTATGKATSRNLSYILSDDELDSDELIALLEDNPTYKRTPQIFKEYKERRDKTLAKIRQSPSDDRERSATSISF